jgi:hypothetical protein
VAGVDRLEHRHHEEREQRHGQGDGQLHSNREPLEHGASFVGAAMW